MGSRRLPDSHRSFRPLQRKFSLADDRRHGERNLHFRETAAQAAVPADAEGGEGAGLLVLRPSGRVALNVEAIGLREVLWQMMAHRGAQQDL